MSRFFDQSQSRDVRLKAKAELYATGIVTICNSAGIPGVIKEWVASPRYLAIGVRLHDPKQLKEAMNLSGPVGSAVRVGADHCRASEDKGLLWYEFELDQAEWRDVTFSELVDVSTIGVDQYGHPVPFSFAAPHVLVAGTTESGKTETVHTILTALMLRYSSEDLNVMIIDPHREYDAFTTKAHLVAPIAHLNHEACQVLGWVTRVLQWRKDDETDNPAWPALVLVIDEAHSVVSDDLNLERVQTLAKEGRKFGIHLIIATQKPNHKVLEGVLDELDLRFLGKMTDLHMSKNFGAGLALQKLSGRGDFLMTHSGKKLRLQVALTEANDVARITDGNNQQFTFVGPVEVGPAKGGRPKVTPDPSYVAWFLHHGADIQRKQAIEALGLTRRQYEVNQHFAALVAQEMERWQDQTQ
jgi:S-DNA-T family DNA segregation ATPase FtsK/SpoIIIE